MRFVDQRQEWPLKASGRRRNRAARKHAIFSLASERGATAQDSRCLRLEVAVDCLHTACDLVHSNRRELRLPRARSGKSGRQVEEGRVCHGAPANAVRGDFVATENIPGSVTGEVIVLAAAGPGRLSPVFPGIWESCLQVVPTFDDAPGPPWSSSVGLQQSGAL